MSKQSLLTQELWNGHSSELSHPTAIGPGVGGGGGCVTGGGLGLGVGCSASGGKPGLVGAGNGRTGSPG